MISLDQLTVNGYPVLLTVDKIVRFLDEYEEMEKVIKIFEISSLMTHYTCAYDYRHSLCRNTEVHDVFKLMNVYGYGVCKQFSLMMEFLLDLCEIDNRVIYLGSPPKNRQNFDHFAIEVYLNGHAHYFDPNLGLYFINTQNTIASIEDIRHQNILQWVGSFSAEKWINANPSLRYLSDTDLFRQQYFDMFLHSEPFTLHDHRFPYKQELMSNRGTVKWYQYLEKKFYARHIFVTTVQPSKGVVDAVLTATTDALPVQNLLFTISKHNPTHTIEINDFPLLIIGCDMTFESASSSEIVLLVNGRSYPLHAAGETDIFEQIVTDNLFENPVYSLAIDSQYPVKTVRLRCQSSVYAQKIFDYIQPRELS
ncbi:hypothetical protein Sulku_2386 [Sulfuricurvum kujiense DSM 16994]|uniref:Uncharacterized protein n=1 Tax=Sulfuricurvum kujiense (strain ATCC BAA-921 / DSM 16994 / JCM 11577 / YK-1) TaxID=709032 RepID=E4TYA1_SULKY|nr:hypothetical protein [Sulfuricurvum kujiense]ADR35046.1 hypothetical protein Sulku_2386 [Sulfuricurvum kujiense DSM 16994]